MDKYLEKKDRRIEKTQKSIRDALITLLAEKDASKITIKELAETANINRKTFYMHYSSIDDIFDKIANEAIEKFLLILDKCDFFYEQFDAYTFFTTLNNVLNEDFDFYQKLVHTNSHNFLLIKVKRILKDSIIEKLHKKLTTNEEVLNLYAEFIASGIISMYVEWLDINSTLSFEDFANAASNIAFNGINSLILT
ncbi:TetR/AcrR family transcriptional regulator [Clostridium gelidum]|uniref:TetR/AcrR family transcriptional regulator n=1 Tax=Clostridium gelidum TaxID=704125 RepID=A0ABN6ITC6_9CLOT|nr:TetR/AcrR family transcriptional regulator [Clostridium gelidum]BCZ45450.1 TetR/AcrR family transcriptional regulator [Clostridium gelidum]